MKQVAAEARKARVALDDAQAALDDAQAALDAAEGGAEGRAVQDAVDAALARTAPEPAERKGAEAFVRGLVALGFAIDKKRTFRRGTLSYRLVDDGHWIRGTDGEYMRVRPEQTFTDGDPDPRPTMAESLDEELKRIARNSAV